MLIEEKTRKKMLKKILEYFIFGTTLSMSFTFLESLLFRDFNIFLGFLVVLVSYGGCLLTYYFTFKKELISFKISTLIFLAIFSAGLIYLTYGAGGYSGSMISAYFITLIVSALLLEKNKAVLVSVSIIILYLIFFVGEFFGFIKPIVKDVAIISYSKAIIDLFAFIVVTFFITIISKTTEESINFYRLRNVRLSKIRKRLEFLVTKRTRQLEGSNRIIRKRTEELERAQASLRKSYKELKKLDVEKDEFISIAAHELKTPLTAIGGYSQLLKNKKIIKNEKKREEFLSILDKESRRLSQLVTEILNLSRIDLGVMKYYIEEVDIYETMKSVEDEFSPKIEERGLNYKFNLEENLPKIKTDGGKLYEIITNLFSNAVKYTLKGMISVKVRKTKNYIQFSVSDTGIGIARKNYKDVFKRFSPIDTSLKRESGGTGLGLSLCKEYVKKLGGKIWFESKLGKGSTFFVKLPIEAG